ncbi:hypothetical protein BOX15_Mlig018648g3, partial [Macrostomum lignano]
STSGSLAIRSGSDSTSGCICCVKCGRQFPTERGARIHQNYCNSSSAAAAPVIAAAASTTAAADSGTRQRQLESGVIIGTVFKREPDTADFSAVDADNLSDMNRSGNAVLLSLNECVFCCRLFDSAEALARHLLSHNQMQPFLCCFCQQPFPSRQTLDWHFVHLHRMQMPGQQQQQPNTAPVISVAASDDMPRQTSPRSSPQTPPPPPPAESESLNQPPAVRGVSGGGKCASTARKKNANKQRQQKSSLGPRKPGLIRKKNLPKIRARLGPTTEEQSSSQQPQAQLDSTEQPVEQSDQQPEAQDKKNKQARQKLNIQAKRKVTSVDPQFTCHLCSRRYWTERELASHFIICLRRRRLTDPEKPKCEFCQKLCGNKLRLISHIRRCHSGRRHFTCLVCRAVFPTRSSVMLHSYRFRRLVNARLSKNANSNTNSSKKTDRRRPRNSVQSEQAVETEAEQSLQAGEELSLEEEQCQDGEQKLYGEPAEQAAAGDSTGGRQWQPFVWCDPNQLAEDLRSATYAAAAADSN